MAAKPAAGTLYGRAYAAGREAQRQVLLDAASGLLEAEGPESILVSGGKSTRYTSPFLFARRLLINTIRS